jgi:large subunit ribosomal protein L31e
MAEEKIKQEEKASKPAVAQEVKPKEAKVELEREYVIPLRRAVIKSPRFGRAKKAIKTMQIFLAKHMKVENRDTRLVKIDRYLNNEIWFRGIKQPPKSIKVKAVKRDGIVYAELAEVPEHVKFLMAKDKKRHTAAVEMPEHEHKHETAEEKKEESEKDKATQEAGLKANKQAHKAEKHTSDAGHEKKTTPRRKALQK